MKLYRPSNGCEGLDFEAKWCEQCAIGKALCGDRDEEEFGLTCPIRHAAFWYEITEDEYPNQWCYDKVSGKPVCTGFEKAAQPVKKIDVSRLTPEEKAWYEKQLEKERKL